jgi:amino acid adenylation domain-containing protein
VRGLSRLTRHHRTTLSTLVHALWGLLLSRYSGRRDVLFGSVTSGRPAELEGVEAMVGLFINTIAVRVTLSRRDTVGEYLGRLHHELWEQRRFEHASLSSLGRWSAIEAGRPLFESLVVFENYPLEALAALAHGDVGLKLASGREQTHYPLTLLALSHGDRLRLIVEYDPRRFEADAMTRLGSHLVNLAAALSASDPGAALDSLEMPSEGERRQLLVEWNDTVQADAEPPLLHEMFEREAERDGDATALSWGDARLSYRALERWATEIALLLRARGVDRETVVGLAMSRSFTMVAGMLGILKAGGTFVSLGLAEPAGRLAHMLRTAQPRLVLTDAAAEPPQLLDVEVLPVPPRSGGPGGPHASWPRADADGGAYLIFTSGSTGQPKGVLVSHRSIVNEVIAAQTRLAPLAPDDVYLQLAPASFDLAVHELFWPICVGAELALMIEGDQRDPRRIVEAIRAHRVTTMHPVPSMLRALVDQVELRECTSLRRIITGAEALPLELMRRVLSHAPTKVLINSYGPSEAAVTVSDWRCHADAPAVAIGKPWRNTALYVVDRALRPVPVGVLGELYIAGVQLARGYVGAPGLTAERFVPCPFVETPGIAPGARMYRTGDVVRYQGDGNIVFLGRIDQQVKLRGHRIELGEVEAALRSLAGVRHAAVLLSPPVSAQVSAEGASQKLVGYLQAEAGWRLSASSLKSQLSERLPDYMVPSAFVVLDELPLTSSGKLDRRALPEPGDEAFERGAYVAPRSYDEEVLCGIYGELLGIERVGVRDDFFALGGHSLLALRLMVRIEERFGKNLTLNAIFFASTVETMAELLNEGG